MMVMTFHVFSFVLFRILDKALGEVSRLIEEKSILFWIFALVIVSRRHFFFVIKGNEHYVIWSIQSINTKLHEINDVRQPFDKSHNFTLEKLFVHLNWFFHQMVQLAEGLNIWQFFPHYWAYHTSKLLPSNFLNKANS